MSHHVALGRQIIPSALIFLSGVKGRFPTVFKAQEKYKSRGNGLGSMGVSAVILPRQHGTNRGAVKLITALTAAVRNYLRQRVYVFTLVICLFVSGIMQKTTQPIFTTFGRQVAQGPRKKELDFGACSPLRGALVAVW